MKGYGKIYHLQSQYAFQKREQRFQLFKMSKTLYYCNRD